ncbi:transposase [Piscirickettsia litoralis]
MGYDYHIEIVELEAPINHIHMVVKSESKVSPPNITQVVKNISARQLF